VQTTSIPIRHPDRFFVDGQWIAPSTDATFAIIQPGNEEPFYVAAAAQAADMEHAITAARAAFDEGPWPRLEHAERAEYLRAFAAGIRARSDDLGFLWTGQMGVIAAMAPLAMKGQGFLYDYYADMASRYPFVERHQPAGGEAVGLLVHEPVGVVGAIIPWNHPMSLIGKKLAPALLAGCTVILKASPEAPGETLVMAEIAEDIGLPPGVVNCLTADRAVSEQMVRDERVDKISFTGSTAAGRRIASLCGERIARYTLELGGKSAAVVLDDFDLGAVAQNLAQNAKIMTGQVCAALTRVIVSNHRHDELVDALSDAFSKVRVGDPWDMTTEMGPLAMSRQRDRVEALIATGTREGARLATGGGRPPGLDRGYFIEPTVFADVDNHSTIAREEIFGPVLSVIPASDERDAVEIANDSIFGLNASVFTDDPDRALHAARRLRSGTVGHNAFRNDITIGFGGFKQSGVGREGGTEGLLPYLESKTILLAAEPVALSTDSTNPGARDPRSE
jgi:aldehyde dehydrogenase (NAD+)